MTTVLFLDMMIPPYSIFSNFQYLWCCIAFTQGKPFRLPVWTNPLYVLTLIWTLLASLGQLFAPNVSWLSSVTAVIDLPTYNYRYILFGVIVGNFVAHWLYETVILALSDRQLNKSMAIVKRMIIREEDRLGNTSKYTSPEVGAGHIQNWNKEGVAPLLD